MGWLRRGGRRWLASSLHHSLPDERLEFDGVRGVLSPAAIVSHLFDGGHLGVGPQDFQSHGLALQGRDCAAHARVFLVPL